MESLFLRRRLRTKTQKPLDLLGVSEAWWGDNSELAYCGMVGRFSGVMPTTSSNSLPLQSQDWAPCRLWNYQGEGSAEPPARPEEGIEFFGKLPYLVTNRYLLTYRSRY